MRREGPICTTDRLAIYRTAVSLKSRRGSTLAIPAAPASVLIAFDQDAWMVASALIVHSEHRGVLHCLHQLEVCSSCRRQGIGTEVLGAIVDLYKPTRAMWATRSGAALAASWQRRHGAVAHWHYALPALPDAEELPTFASAAERERHVEELLAIAGGVERLVTHHELAAFIEHELDPHVREQARRLLHGAAATPNDQHPALVDAIGAGDPVTTAPEISL